MSSAYLYNQFANSGDYNFDKPMGVDEISAGTGSLTSNDKEPTARYKDIGRGALMGMNSGASLGGTLTGAGAAGLIAGTGGIAAPAALGAGLALSFYEQQKQAEAMNEKAKVEEAQNRKQATQNAINGLINVTQHLGV